MASSPSFQLIGVSIIVVGWRDIRGCNCPNLAALPRWLESCLGEGPVGDAMKIRLKVSPCSLLWGRVSVRPRGLSIGGSLRGKTLPPCPTRHRKSLARPRGRRLLAWRALTIRRATGWQHTCATTFTTPSSSRMTGRAQCTPLGRVYDRSATRAVAQTVTRR